MSSLTGKVAIVTASSRGIGRSLAKPLETRIALRLGRDGAAVAVNYVASPEKAEAVVKEIIASGGRSIAIQGSVADKADVTRLFDETEKQLGSIDIVINVAGVAFDRLHTDLTDEDLDKVFSVNVRGVMYMLQAAADRVKDGGRIVQFSTGATKHPRITGVLYAASKAAGEQFAFSLAKEIGHRQVRINVVLPEVTEPDELILPQPALAKPTGGNRSIDRLVSQTPLGRLGKPQDMADVGAFLVGDDAHWMTGQNLQVNGRILSLSKIPRCRSQS